MTEFVYFEKIENETYFEEIFELMCRFDKAFIPPLSSRKTTTDACLSGLSEGDEKPVAYLETMKEQSFVLALVDGHVRGFMSFRDYYENEALHLPAGRTLYASTCIVDESLRGQGIMSKFYDYMIHDIKDPRPVAVATRTWHTNAPHLRVLEKHGFELVKRLPNDRGEGIDTVYFVKVI